MAMQAKQALLRHSSFPAQKSFKSGSQTIVRTYRDGLAHATSSSSHSIQEVEVYFRKEQVSVKAVPGEYFSKVISRANVEVPYNCCTGDCGVCEVEMFLSSVDDSAPCSEVIRSCVAVVPSGCKRIEIGLLDDEMIW